MVNFDGKILSLCRLYIYNIMYVLKALMYPHSISMGATNACIYTCLLLFLKILTFIIIIITGRSPQLIKDASTAELRWKISEKQSLLFYCRACLENKDNIFVESRKAALTAKLGQCN